MGKFKRQTVAVATFEQGQQVQSQTVEALVLGDLAVHKPLCGGGYAVTHVPSGFKLAEGWKQRNCKALVAELFALNLNWKFDAHFMPQDVREQALPIVRAFNSNPAS